MLVPIRSQSILILTCLFLALAGGCSSGINLQVKSEVPMPLATRLPLVLGIHYPEHFRDYVYSEDSATRKDWSIDFRDSRLSLFEQILPTMFTSVKPVDDVSTEAAVLVDLILEPDVLEAQFALPEETRTDMYEAWIKYAIKLYEPGGDTVSEWQVTGYGKTPTAMFTSKEEGLNTAVSLALRDIGARFVLDLRNAPGMREWLTDKINCAEYPHLC